MMNCKHIPQLVVLNIVKDDAQQQAIFNLCGTFPACGRFDICLNACANETCSGYQVFLCDSEGHVQNAVNLHGNNLTLGQANIQAARNRVLHFRRSIDYPQFSVMCDKLLCSPTPILSAQVSRATTTTATTKSKA